MVTGNEFEGAFCELLKSIGYWALNIPKNKSGAQPFDVIALKGSSVLAIDCKVCQGKRFPIDRIEDNQWLAFQTVYDKSIACVGIAVLHDGDVYFFNYIELVKLKEAGVPSIPVSKRVQNIWFSEDVIKNTIGRILK